MVATSNIVYLVVALCGAASAAPSVTYDQRQNGEFNVHVEADGVAVVLLPGGSASDLFDMRKHHVLTTGDKWQQIFGRRNGVNVFSKKKKDKCTTVKPEKPYTQSPSYPSSSSSYPSSSSSSSSPPAESSTPYPAEESLVPVPSPVQENPANVVGPEDLDVRFGGDRPHYIRPGTSVEDPYSVTPDTPDIFPRPETDDDDDDVDDDAVATATDSVAETTAVAPKQRPVAGHMKTDEKSAAVAAENKSSPTTTAAASDYEEKPVQSVSSSPDVKTVEKSDSVAHDAAVNVVAVPPKTQTRPEEKVADGTAVDANATVAQVVKAAEPSSDKKNPDEQRPAVEMVAMKTMEKPTFSEPLKVQTRKQQPPAAVPVDEKPAAEMVAMKTIDKPSTSADAATTTTADKSVITKSAEISPTQADAVKGGGGRPGEAAVSRSKPTEMVAVKTVESPGATSTTAKSVVSVRTVIRPGSPKPAAATVSSNGTSVMRKVGDRKPLPMVTLEVSHPKVVV